MVQSLEDCVKQMKAEVDAIFLHLPENCTEMQARSTGILNRRVDSLIDAMQTLENTPAWLYTSEQRHYLRNIITPILSYASLIASGRVGELPPNLCTYAANVADYVREFNELLDILRDNPQNYKE